MSGTVKSRQRQRWGGGGGQGVKAHRKEEHLSRTVMPQTQGRLVQTHLRTAPCGWGYSTVLPCAKLGAIEEKHEAGSRGTSRAL